MAVGRYERALRGTITYPKSVLAGAAAVVAAALVLSAFLGIGVFAATRRGRGLDSRQSPGRNLTRQVGRVGDAKSAQLVHAISGGARSASQTGRNDSGTDPFGPNRNELFVALKPYDTWPKATDKATLIEELSQRPRSGTSQALRSTLRSRSSTTSPSRSRARRPIWRSSLSAAT